MRYSRRYDFQGHPRSGSRSGDDLSPILGLFYNLAVISIQTSFQEESLTLTSRSNQPFLHNTPGSRTDGQTGSQTGHATKPIPTPAYGLYDDATRLIIMPPLQTTERNEENAILTDGGGCRRRRTHDEFEEARLRAGDNARVDPVTLDLGQLTSH